MKVQSSARVRVKPCSGEKFQSPEERSCSQVLYIRGEHERCASVELFDTCLPADSETNCLGQGIGLMWQFYGSGYNFRKEGFDLSQVLPLYGVAAIWPVDPIASDEFFQRACLNGENSVALEKGCISFGVFRSSVSRSLFGLIEVFMHRDAFENHLSTTHFEEFIVFARQVYVGDRAQTVKGDTETRS